MNNTNQHEDGKNAYSAAIGSLLQTTSPVWLGAKPTWCTWDHIIRKHCLGSKPSQPLKLASFVNFEDCKQDFVAEFQPESPHVLPILVAWGRTPFFFPPSLSWIIKQASSVPGIAACHWQGKATPVWISFLTWVCQLVRPSQWWSGQVIWLWSVKCHTWTLFHQIYALKQIRLCWIYANRAFGGCWPKYFFLAHTLGL